MSKLSYNKYYDNFTQIYFSTRWLVRAVIQNRDARVPTEDESVLSSKIGTIPPNSGRLDTVRSGGMLPRRKLEICGLQTAGDALKLSILPSPCYFCIKYFTIPSGGPFWLFGGGCVRTPRTPLPTGLH